MMLRQLGQRAMVERLAVRADRLRVIGVVHQLVPLGHAVGTEGHDRADYLRNEGTRCRALSSCCAESHTRRVLSGSFS